MNSIIKYCMCFLMLGLVAGNCFADGRPDKPNVVLILIDDLGWQDVQCYDIDKPCPYETPNIDQLSKEGVKFLQAYSPAPTCSPSRGAILTGKHPARLQRTHVVGGAPPMPINEKISRVITPWYKGRLSVDETTIPEVLKTNGYVTGHVGKWHIAIHHDAYPQPKDHGFDYSVSDRGVTNRMKPHRLTGFATKDSNDLYQLDKNGFPKDPNNLNALNFLNKNKSKPFFLYYATWLVHAPIQTRCKALLEKYCKKLNVPFPTDPIGWDIEGQNNPYYASMVEMLDYYVGQVINYLRETEDPRWKGHKLIENTYVIFTSDNGGMEGHHGEVITDNYPLDKGKINAKEGGTRVPLIITGPGIKPNQTSNVMVNGIDFFPTILSWTGSKYEKEKEFDGLDLSELLASNPKDKELVINKNGKVRETILHHFPHGPMHSTIRVGDYKLIHNFDPEKGAELYRLYENGNNRLDIEEMKDLSKDLPLMTKKLDQLLLDTLKSMDAALPFYNPYCESDIPYKNGICEFVGNGKEEHSVWAKFKEKGNKVIEANLLYTLNGGAKYEEWFQMKATVEEGNIVKADLPKGATHYVFNIIDEHNFLVSYPRMGRNANLKIKKHSIKAFSVKEVDNSIDTNKN
ncbi:N-acetylgalactosamine-6-sulfatase [Puteibacter caeruleilacunae]|nr:N-acetylgalactosamine-6-sulfatase [Puteibacter caeruleilacunae]